jgi:hypothetical protein
MELEFRKGFAAVELEIMQKEIALHGFRLDLCPSELRKCHEDKRGAFKTAAVPSY